MIDGNRCASFPNQCWPSNDSAGEQSAFDGGSNITFLQNGANGCIHGAGRRECGRYRANFFDFRIRVSWSAAEHGAESLSKSCANLCCSEMTAVNGKFDIDSSRLARRTSDGGGTDQTGV
jgi:hypothetical protein